MPQSYDDWKTDVGDWPDAEQGRPTPCLDCGRVYDWRAEPPASGLYCADCVSAHTGSNLSPHETDELLGQMIDRAGALKKYASDASRAYEGMRARIAALMKHGRLDAVCGKKYQAMLEMQVKRTISPRELYEWLGDEAFDLMTVPVTAASARLSTELFDRLVEKVQSEEPTLFIREAPTVEDQVNDRLDQLADAILSHRK